MIQLEMFGEALRSLGRHKLRSILTAMGIVFGIGSVMAMVSLGEGARRQILEEIGEMGIRNIIVNAVEPPAEEKANAEESSILRYGLTFDDVQQIRETVPLVSRVLPVHERKSWIWFRSKRLAGALRGVKPEYLDNLNLRPVFGRALTPSDESERKRVCVVRARLLRELGFAGDPLTLDLKVGGDVYRIVGVLPDYEFRGMAQTALGVDDRRYEVYAPFDTVVDRLGFQEIEYTGSSYTNRRVELHQMVCEAADANDVLEAAKCVQAVLVKNHAKRDYDMTVPLELLASRQSAQRMFDIGLLIIASISLFVGGIGILNIMLASVTERTREIGIRRAIGATQGDITTQFLIETVTLAAIGGALGVIFGVAMSFVGETFTGWPPVITAWAVALSLAISCSTGVVFGLYPAWRAAQMNPIQALRHE